MEKKIYVCDRCGKEMSTFNKVILWINMEKYKKQFCDGCSEDAHQLINKKED